MSGKRFQSRAKTVQKLGRDGLVEQNMATGEEKRVSQRTADVSFGPARPQEQAAGHRAVQRSGGDSVSPGKKRRKQPRPVQQTAEEAAAGGKAHPERRPFSGRSGYAHCWGRSHAEPSPRPRAKALGETPAPSSGGGRTAAIQGGRG